MRTVFAAQGDVPQFDADQNFATECNTFSPAQVNAKGDPEDLHENTEAITVVENATITKSGLFVSINWKSFAVFTRHALRMVIVDRWDELSNREVGPV